MKHYCWILSFTLILLNPGQIQSQDSLATVDAYLLSHFQKGTQGNFGYVITNDHVSKISDVHHYYFSQTLNGIQISGTNSSLHISATNKTISESNHFLEDVANRSTSSQVPLLSANEVVSSVADQLGYKMTEDLVVLNKKEGESNEQLLSNGGISIGPIPIKLKYLVSENGELELIWELAIQEPSGEHFWNIRASATTGKIIEKDDFVVNCSLEHDHSDENLKLNTSRAVKKPSAINPISEGVGMNCTECYEVIKYPLESPLHGDRSIEIMSANLDASPLGWHDSNGVAGADYTVTRGNNAFAFKGDGDNYGYQPDGGVSLNFTGYEFNTIYSETNLYEDASITNLFYWINILHDLMFEYGFTEAAGNFQNVNYSGEGISADPVYAQAQNNSGGCNASFSVPYDGLNPTMRINTCGDKDGAFDNSVIIHEFAHGVTIRLVGGSGVSSCLFNSEQMGEGWSDWYALVTTMKAEDSEELPRGIATYYRGVGALGGGVREYPYTTDITLNPLTYDSIKTVGRPHGVGTVWAEMLWEMTWGLVNKYGFDPNLNNFTGNINRDAGNVMAMAIVTEALKFTPCSPGFVDARDAIMTAGRALYGIEIDCVLWPAFAKRGLGINAFQGVSNSLEDGLESYELPPSNAVFKITRDQLCDEAQILSNENGGLPYGGTYSGPGVTDNGDGRSYTFDPTILGTGNFSISYTIMGSDCQGASTAVDTVQIVSDNEAPIITCREDLIVTVPFGETSYSLQYFAPISRDNCTSSLHHRQEPILNSALDLGSTLVTLYMSDASGNESTCSFNITVMANENNISGDESTDLISLFPNPTNGEVSMNSVVDIGSLALTIFDINGRLVGELLYRRFGYHNTFSLKDYTSGLYIVKFETEEFSQVHKFVKN
jgi:extracellular elastinolytic metalloproteinase